MMSSYDDLPVSNQQRVRRAFDALATVGGAGVKLINEVALPHICRAMNLSLTEEDMYAVCQMYSLNPPQQKLASSSLFALPAAEFDFACIQRIFNAYAPIQQDQVKLYHQFFRLLDIHEVGSVSQSDLRHCLCTTGERLSDEEFNHLMYANDLLHKPRLTAYEFVRLLLRMTAGGTAL